MLGKEFSEGCTPHQCWSCTLKAGWLGFLAHNQFWAWKTGELEEFRLFPWDMFPEVKLLLLKHTTTLLSNVYQVILQVRKHESAPLCKGLVCLHLVDTEKAHS